MSEKFPVRYSSEFTLAKAHEGDAAYDIHIAENVTLDSLDRKKVSTTLVLEQSPGMAALVLPRSGFSSRTGVTVLNSPGLVDSGYRGEVLVSLVNLSRETVSIEKGTRVAQLMFTPVLDVVLEKVDHDVISESHDGRGSGGFGSSGSR